MEDWYNDSLPRYPRMLIKKEQIPLSSQINRTSDASPGGNVIRIRVQGRRSGDQELDLPTVTVRRYNNDRSASQPKVTVETVKCGSGTAIPIQIRHISTGPVAKIACAQPTTAYNRRPEPMKAVPLTSVNYDYNGNPLDLRRQLSDSNSSPTHFPPPHRLPPQRFRSPLRNNVHSPLTDNVFDSCERQFDRFTSEYTSSAADAATAATANKPYVRSQSQKIEDPKSYAPRRHESEDISAYRHRHSSLNSSSTDRYVVRGERSASPNVYVSTYSRTTLSTPRQSPIKSPTTATSPDDRKSIPQARKSKCSSDSQTDQTDGPDQMSVARAKWVLDKVLKDLDGLKGQRKNSIISEAKDSIKKFSDELSSSKGCHGDDTDSGYSGSGDTTQTGFTWSTLDIKEQIKKHNENNRESKLTKVVGDKETFQGDIQICMCLEHPVSMLLNTRPKSIFESLSNAGEEEKITASATIPNNTITKLHITSEDSTDSVIQQLLNKFNIIDSPKAYGLYEQTLDTQTDKEVKLRKAARSERPLLNFLKWSTETQSRKRFLLKESYNGDIQWDSFCIPELSNFILMLEMEYKCQLDLITKKFSTYRHNVKSRMRELRPDATATCS